MKVILNKDISGLGEEGDIKEVARGYARNFLIPQKLALPCTSETLSLFNSRRAAIEQRREEKRRAALDVKTRLEEESLVIEMPAGDRGRLFGSVTAATIAEALGAKGIEVERRRIDIPEKTIKTVGVTRVRVRLYGEEEAELRVQVCAIGAQAEPAGPVSPSAAASDGASGAATVPETAEAGTDELKEPDVSGAGEA